MMTKALTTCLATALISGVLLAQVDQPPILEETVQVLHFEPLDYPLIAHAIHREGSVVVKVELNSRGEVMSARALAGPKLLIPESVENATKWRFHLDSGSAVLIVYNFRIEGTCRRPCSSNFMLHPPNVVTISIGAPIMDHAAGADSN